MLKFLATIGSLLQKEGALGMVGLRFFLAQILMTPQSDYLPKHACSKSILAVKLILG